MKTKPVLSWPGGKTRLLKSILPLIGPHSCYVEAFAGGLAVLLAKERSKQEVVNDLNSDIVCLYRCAQYHLNALIQEIEWMIASRENIKDFLSQPGLTDLQRAARFLIRNKTSFGGSGTSFAVSKTRSLISRESVMKMLSDLSVRLDGVAIENAPFERILKNYDSADTLFFLDPPYISADIGSYAPWDEAKMTEFANCVHKLQANWIVTVNDSPFTRQLFRKHTITPVVTRSGTTNRSTHSEASFGELIIQKKKTVLMGTPKGLKKAA